MKKKNAWSMDDTERWSIEDAERDFQEFAASFDWSTPNWDVPKWGTGTNVEPRVKHGTNETP